MNVIQIINAVSTDDLTEAYLRLYDCEPYEGKAHWVTHFERFRADINAMVTVTGEPLVVEFRLDRHGCHDVVGVDPEGHAFALDFTPWGVWKGLEVRSDLPLAEQAAHLFEEITWYGGPEEAEAARDEVEDRVEKIARAFDSGDFTGFSTLDDFLKRMRDRFPEEDN